MKDIKQTPSWSKVVAARKALKKTPEAGKPAANTAYVEAVRKALDERAGTVGVKTPRRFR